MARRREPAEPTNWQGVELSDFREEPLGLRLAMVGEARELFGKAAGQRVWVLLGLPNPMLPRAAPDTALVEHLRRFADNCVVREIGSTCTAAAVFSAYRQWAVGTAFATITQTAFGRSFAKLNIRKRKSHSTIYLDIRLASEPSLMERLL